jgi:hypothetical protein
VSTLTLHLAIVAVCITAIIIVAVWSAIRLFIAMIETIDNLLEKIAKKGKP